MSQRLLLFAKILLTMDRPEPIEDGFVLTEGDRILQVGRRRDLYVRPTARLLDLGDTILMPGLINAHCHLDFTHLKGKVRYKGAFREWLREMGRRTRETSQAEFRRSVQEGVRESLAYGTTTLCDTATSWESWQVLRRSGSRAFVFFELLDLAQPSAGEYWKAFERRLRLTLHQAPPTETCAWGLSPHTPFTVSKELLQLAGRSLAGRKGVLTSIHLSESREEAAYFRKGTGPLADRLSLLNPGRVHPRGTTPVQYLNANGWLPKLDLGVHLNKVEEKDLDLLAKNRVAAVHCPGSHAYFGHPSFRYGAFRRRQITVCLGTDSLASNGSLSLFREMRLFRKRNPGVGDREILGLATEKPAQALGLGHKLGRIKPGHWADLIGIPAAGSPARGAYRRVLDHRGTVSFSMIHGLSQWRLSQGK